MGPNEKTDSDDKHADHDHYPSHTGEKDCPLDNPRDGYCTYPDIDPTADNK